MVPERAGAGAGLAAVREGAAEGERSGSKSAAGNGASGRGVRLRAEQPGGGEPSERAVSRCELCEPSAPRVLKAFASGACSLSRVADSRMAPSAPFSEELMVKPGA